VVSDYVVVVFYNAATGPPPYPLKSLVAYERLHDIAPDAVGTADLRLTLGALARREENGDLVLYPGKYELLLDVPTQATLVFHLTGTETVLENWPQPPADETYDAVRDCQLEGVCGDHYSD
jgi:beta-D-xylosidase 4